MNCGNCGYTGRGDTPEERAADLFTHLKTHPPRVITDMSEVFPDAGQTVAVEVEVIAPATLRDLPEYTCGQCGETFGTNFLPDEIECAYCEARRCPHCELWFGGES